VRKSALSALAAALVGSGSFALAASGGERSHGIDVRAATVRTAKASSVHYSFAVRMTTAARPLLLHVDGGSSRDSVSVRLRLADLAVSAGTTMPGVSGAIMLSKPFLYERAPGGVAVFGTVRWLRLQLGGLSPRSQTLSAVRSLTPAPLLRVVAEAKLHAAGSAGVFSGTVAYDDPVVRTALHALGGGLEFRNLRISVKVGRDGLVHRVRLTGRTADRRTKLALVARLYAFGAPVLVRPPKPGTFVDEQLAQLAT
jgi:hypothetical protein